MAKLHDYYKSIDKTKHHEGEDDGEEEKNPFDILRQKQRELDQFASL